MTIDLRYVLVVLAFFAPAVLLRFWLLLWGLPLTHPDAIAFATFAVGLLTSCTAAAVLFSNNYSRPIPFKLWGRK